MLASRGQAAVRRELLVGFDPVPLFASLLESRLAHVAHVCADYTGGVPLMALKWRAPAFKPGPLRPEQAHTQRPLGSAEGAADAEVATGKHGKRSALDAVRPLLLVPDVPAILEDIATLGAGLVESVQLL